MKILKGLFYFLTVSSSSVVAWNLIIPPREAFKSTNNNGNASVTTRRDALLRVVTLASVSLVGTTCTGSDSASAIATIDVNNAMAREFTAFPGLYPTVATKIVNAAKEQPFTSKQQVYAVLNDLEQERLRQYDKSIMIAKPDKALQQFKTSQICKYECGSRTSSTYRDEQIKAVQTDRSK